MTTPAPWSAEVNWQNVNRMRELAKHEGDVACERAFDFLVATLDVERAAREAAEREIARLRGVIVSAARSRRSVR